MPFLNPGGHNFIGYNHDGWGIVQLVFAVFFSILILVLSAVLWRHRNEPVIRMRKVPLSIAATLTLHVYTVIVLIVYPVNEHWPCGVEFWVMSIYLPIGIGLFQAQNQILLRTSRGQQHLLTQDIYRPLPTGKTVRQYYWNAFKLWCQAAREGDYFEGFVAAGILLQFLVSLIIYVISRQFNSYGIVSHPVNEAMCRRGWEWAPSIIWQALWNYIAGPYLLWKIRMINDIYNWRLQTTIAVVAGLPGTPLWVLAVYSDKLSAVNKYWNPAMWFLPGLVTLEMVSVCGPLVTLWTNRSVAKENKRALDEFDNKKTKGILPPNGSLTTTSTKSHSSGGSRFNMQSLDECLNSHGPEFEAFHHFCATKALCGENVLFLEKTIKFKNEWARVFSVPDCSLEKAKMHMYRNAVDIYLKLVNQPTAAYPINVEGKIYSTLKSLFGAAANMIATRRPSTPRSVSHVATPWDEPADPFTAPGNDHPLRPILRRSIDKQSSTTELITEIDFSVALDDPLSGITIPDGFGQNCFDGAMASVKHMVWQEPWQKFMRSKRNSAVSLP
ncbi:MAG: hypothetical protein Q9218_006458 [Villophora microphyllina]